MDKIVKMKVWKVLFAFFYAINKTSGRNTTQGTNYIWWERTKCTDIPLYPNKLANMRRYIIKCNHLKDSEKDNIEKQVVVVIQRNETLALKMNAVNNEINITINRSSNNCMKTPGTKKECIKKRIVNLKSSPLRAASTDFPDPLPPLVPIVHRSR